MRKTMTMMIMLPISLINRTFSYQNTFTIGMFCTIALRMV